MENNIFLNKDYFSQQFNKDYRQKRLDDMLKIYNVLKDYLKPMSKAFINEKKIKKYVDLYKPENREFIKRVLNAIVHIPFDKFERDLITEVNKFNLIENRKYIFVLGVNNDVGTSNMNFNLFKSNLWVYFLIYSHLKIKPYDIILNLKIAIQLYGNEYEYLIVDDCSYSGTQLVDQVLYESASETLFKFPNSFISPGAIHKTLLKPIEEKKITINIILPYLSKISYDKISNLNILTCFKINLFNKYIVNSFQNVLIKEDLDKLYNFYNQFYSKYNSDNLIPIFFDHKVADILSCPELILIKGQVLDNPKKRLVFIDACDIHDPKQERYLLKILKCPKSPYYYFEEILKKKLK